METHEPASWRVSREAHVLFPHFCFCVAVSGESPSIYSQHLWKVKFTATEFKWGLYAIHDIWCFFYLLCVFVVAVQLLSHVQVFATSSSIIVTLSTHYYHFYITSLLRHIFSFAFFPSNPTTLPIHTSNKKLLCKLKKKIVLEYFKTYIKVEEY